MSQSIKGIIAYPITPFTADNRIDLPLYKSLAEKLITSGVHTLAPLGSTGVLPYLNDDEKEALVTASMELAQDRLPVIVGVSNLTTERTVHHARFAEKAGAAAVMIIPMSYWKLTDDEIFAHYETVARHISLPIMVYNNPATGGIDLSPALLQRLTEISNVTMIKESSGDLQRMHQLRHTLGDRVAFYNGSNPLALGAFAAGAAGWCTAAPNLIPELNLALYDAVSENDLRRARELFHRQYELLRFIVAKGLPRAVKAGLKLQGIESGYLRAPLQALNDEETRELARILHETV